MTGAAHSQRATNCGLRKGRLRESAATCGGIAGPADFTQHPMCTNVPCLGRGATTPRQPRRHVTASPNWETRRSLPLLTDDVSRRRRTRRRYVDGLHERISTRVCGVWGSRAESRCATPSALGVALLRCSARHSLDSGQGIHRTLVCTPAPIPRPRPSRRPRLPARAFAPAHSSRPHRTSPPRCSLQVEEKTYFPPPYSPVLAIASRCPGLPTDSRYWSYGHVSTTWGQAEMPQRVIFAAKRVRMICGHPAPGWF